MSPSTEIETGTKCGLLTAIRPTKAKPRKDGSRVLTWIWRCDCGKEVARTPSAIRATLKRGAVPNCGCQGYTSLKLPKGMAARNSLISKYRYAAKKKGREWRLTTEQAEELFKGNCFYCGSEPQGVHKILSNNGDYVFSGIDRLDSTQGYVPGNVVSCCKICNFAKWNRNLPEFIAWIRKVYEHTKDLEI